MGFLDRLLGRQAERQSAEDRPEPTTAPTVSRFAPLPQDNFMKVVGESHYQYALRALTSECIPGADGRPSFTAALVREPYNPYDTNALAVYGPTGQIGYLAREDAARYVDTFDFLREIGYDGGSCTGLLNGGDRDRPSIGVVLTLAYPETCERHFGIVPDVETPDASPAAGGTTDSGKLRGKHYSAFVQEVKALRRHGHDDSAETLLLELVAVVEAEAAQERWGVAPWYYEQLAIIYRKRRDGAAEVAILERYAAAPPAPGTGSEKLRQRLDKAHVLAAQKSQSP